MYPDEQEMNDVKLELGLLKKDVQMTDRLCEKLTESISKIEQLNINLSRMISLHEEKHQQHDRVENELKEDIKELHSRITTTNRELHDRIDEVERHIAAKIDSLRVELQQHEESETSKNKLANTLKEIDKYKFAIVAVAIAVGWILGNVNLQVLGTLIK